MNSYLGPDKKIIKNKENELLYRKPTQTDTTINATSIHPKQHKEQQTKLQHINKHNNKKSRKQCVYKKTRLKKYTTK